MKRIEFTASAFRSFRKLPLPIRGRIESTVGRYADTGAGDVKVLVGEPRFRLRVGDYRVIFTETPTAILIHVVGHRRDIYR